MELSTKKSNQQWLLFFFALNSTILQIHTFYKSQLANFFDEKRHTIRVASFLIEVAFFLINLTKNKKDVINNSKQRIV